MCSVDWLFAFLLRGALSPTVTFCSNAPATLYRGIVAANYCLSVKMVVLLYHSQQFFDPLV